MIIFDLSARRFGTIIITNSPGLDACVCVCESVPIYKGEVDDIRGKPSRALSDECVCVRVCVVSDESEYVIMTNAFGSLSKRRSRSHEWHVCVCVCVWAPSLRPLSYELCFWNEELTSGHMNTLVKII